MLVKNNTEGNGIAFSRSRRFRAGETVNGLIPSRPSQASGPPFSTIIPSHNSPSLDMPGSAHLITQVIKLSALVDTRAREAEDGSFSGQSKITQPQQICQVIRPLTLQSVNSLCLRKSPPLELHQKLR